LRAGLKTSAAGTEIRIGSGHDPLVRLGRRPLVSGLGGFLVAVGGRTVRVLKRLMPGLVAVVLTVAFSGCNGGSVDRHALTNDASTLDSIACEGALLAHDVARGRTTRFFAREQAEELRIQSSNFADALSKRPTVAAIEQKVRRKAKDAAALAATLQRLHDHPSDRAVGAALERSRKRMGSCP
jgi:hypothetical protein